MQYIVHKVVPGIEAGRSKNTNLLPELEFNENHILSIGINDIKKELEKNFSSQIKLNYKCDPSLIGGLVVQVGSTMVDTSIKNKLQKIENRMIEA